MTDQQLLRKFRLGFKKVTDKESGKTYYAGKDLAKKVSILRYWIVSTSLLEALIFIVLPFKVEIKVAIFALFVIPEIFSFFTFGRLLVKETDLNDVEEI